MSNMRNETAFGAQTLLTVRQAARSDGTGLQLLGFSDHQVAEIHDSGALDPPRKQAAE
jgi:hypothetical protein